MFKRLISNFVKTLGATRKEWPLFLFALSPSLEQWQEWRTLLHTRDATFSEERSEMVNDEFFLTSEGRTDFKAEALAFAQAADPKSDRRFTLQGEKLHAQCAFPLRFQWLKEVSKSPIAEVPCPSLTKWITQLGARSVVLVFSAPYLGSPASLFGHTFFRVDKKKDPTDPELMLSYGVGFEATASANDALMYAIKGLMGLYPGRYSVTPYYQKVQEYGHVENRDLHEYRLNLTPEETQRFALHLWEMQFAVARYFFFNRNCSYHTLALLEVARPGTRLREQFGVMTVPVDTVRAVRAAGLITEEPHYRPSLKSQILAGLHTLEPKERTHFFDLRKGGPLKGDESAALLDTLLDDEQYRAFKGGKSPLDASHTLREDLLVARAQQVEDRKTPEVTAPTPPEAAHGSSRVALSAGRIPRGTGTFLEFRPAFHGLLDPEAGMLPYSRLSLAETKLGVARMGDRTRLRLQELEVASVEQYAPSTKLDFQPAWVLGGKLLRFNDPDNFDHLGFRFQAGYGASKEVKVGTARFLGYLMGKGAIDAFGFDHFARLRPSTSVGLVFTLGSFRIWNEAETSIRFPWKTSWALQLETKVAYAITTDLQITAQYTEVRGDNSFRSRSATGAIAYFY